MMLTGKKLFNTLLTELNEMGLPGMSATLDEMYRSPKFQELDPLTAIAQLVEPEYQKKMNKRIQSRLRIAHLKGCPQELTNCFDSAERMYLPAGITETLAALDFVDAGLNICILGAVSPTWLRPLALPPATAIGCSTTTVSRCWRSLWPSRSRTTPNTRSG